AVPGAPTDTRRGQLLDLEHRPADRGGRGPRYLFRLRRRAEAARVRRYPAGSLEISPRMPTYLLLIGGPGAGKGTQAQKLREVYGLQQVASGDLFRDNLKRSTPLGQLARQYMDRG